MALGNEKKLALLRLQAQKKLALQLLQWQNLTWISRADKFLSTHWEGKNNSFSMWKKIPLYSFQEKG